MSGDALLGVIAENERASVDMSDREEFWDSWDSSVWPTSDGPVVDFK